jgi:hypothetical protein
LNKEYIKIIQKIDLLGNNLLPKQPLDKYPATKSKSLKKEEIKLSLLKGKPETSVQIEQSENTIKRIKNNIIN